MTTGGDRCFGTDWFFIGFPTTHPEITRIKEINFETGKNLSGSDDHDDNDDDFYNEGKKLRDMFYLLSSLLAALTRRGTLLQMKINITITITTSNSQ